MKTVTIRNIPEDVHRAIRVRAATHGRRTKGLAIGREDGYIAATATANGFTIATRDTNPLEAVGLSVINPWVN